MAEDPSFDLDIDIGLDLSSFEISSTEPSSLASPSTIASSRTSVIDDGDLNIPRAMGEVSSQSSIPGDGGINIDDGDDLLLDHYSVCGNCESRAPSVSVQNQEPGLVEAMFEIAEDGSLVFPNAGPERQTS